MTKDTYATKMIFRTWRNGEVIAIMPEIPYDIAGNYMMSYMHVGQHGASSSCPHNTRLATADEIQPLKRELERIGYRVSIRKRETRKMRETRRDTAKLDRLWRNQDNDR